ncbi:MAG: TrkA family potassium uptake protein [Corynebacterium sp.]|nr:TrkA family potassium uptake protein [Corynebacterium sp.]
MANLFSVFRGRDLSQDPETLNVSPVVVIGLGRFGLALATELVEHGVEVFGIDNQDKVVKEHARMLTDAAVANTTDPEVLQQLGIDEVAHVVVAIGSHLEDSILTVSNLVEAGAKDIWAKADSEAHARILTQLGAHHVIRPERDTGRRVAHLLGGQCYEFAQLDSNYGVIKMTPPASLLSQPIDVTAVWDTQQVQVISVKKSSWEPVRDGMQLSPQDMIMVAGSPRALEAFSRSMKCAPGSQV